MTISIFVTENGTEAAATPTLLVRSNHQVPDHPEGGTWRLLAVVGEDPVRVFKGRSLAKTVDRVGYAITSKTVEELIWPR